MSLTPKVPGKLRIAHGRLRVTFANAGSDRTVREGGHFGYRHPRRSSFTHTEVRQPLLDLGSVTVQIWHPDPSYTRGDTIAWVEEEKVLLSGDLVKYEAGVYTGAAQLE